MTTTLEYTGKLTVTSCWCGIHLAIPADLYRAARNQGQSVYCPLGHEFVWSTTEVDQLKAKLEEAERFRKNAVRRTELAEQSAQWARDQLGASERSRRALKGQLTRVRNKVANGVCPVAGCRRHFDNVQAHIATQHPDWAVIDPSTGEAAQL